MAITLEQARQMLRVDAGANDALIESLLAAIPPYIEVATGLTAEEQEGESMVYTVSDMLLNLWYFTQDTEDHKLTRCINSLLFALSLRKQAITASEGN